MTNNYYVIQLFDRMNNLIAPFGHIDYLKLPATNFIPGSATTFSFNTTGIASYTYSPSTAGTSSIYSIGPAVNTAINPTSMGNVYSTIGKVPNNYWPVFSTTDTRTLSASYKDFKTNEAAKKFMQYFVQEENMQKHFCGSIFASNPLKPMYYFDDAYLQSFTFKGDDLQFEMSVLDFETFD